VSKPVPRPPAKLALPGPCVDPIHDALDRLGPDADREGLREEQSVDLDGDGQADRFLTHGSFCGTGGCTWHLYVTRGTCAHYVGELFGALPIVRVRPDKGLVELEIAARTGCAGMARTETRARFDGRVYVPHAARKCRCPEPSDETSPEPDPEALCEAWSPVAPAP
jgi:hypothetical protein